MGHVGILIRVAAGIQYLLEQGTKNLTAERSGDAAFKICFFSFCYFRTSPSVLPVLVHSYEEEEADCTKYQPIFRGYMIDYHMGFTFNKNNQIGVRILFQIVAR